MRSVDELKQKPGTLLYKCRKCDVIFGHTHCPDVFITVLSILDGTEQPFEGIPVSLYQTHICDDNSFGVGDLIGGKYDVS